MNLPSGLDSLAAGLKRYWLLRTHESSDIDETDNISAFMDELLKQAADGSGMRRLGEDSPESSLLRNVFPEGPPGLDEFREFAAEQELPVRELQAESGMIGNSPKLKRVLHMASRYARTRMPLLITGESGTGKELLAGFLHRASNRTGDFVPVNCGALSSSLLESELFGHEPYAFTGAGPQGRIGRVEASASGTLFLDEVAELPLEAQARLLRLLDSGEIQRVGLPTPHNVDVRVLCATHQNLAALVAAGRFRKDLFYRIAAVELTLPPLRERPKDVSVLAGYFLRKSQRRYSRLDPRDFSPDAMKLLERHTWPGNVRELNFVVERAFIDTIGEQIQPDALTPSLANQDLLNEELLTDDELTSELVSRLAKARPSMFRKPNRWATFLLNFHNKPISNRDIVREFDISEAGARLRLNTLVELGILHAEGSKKGRKYLLLPPFSA